MTIAAAGHRAHALARASLDIEAREQRLDLFTGQAAQVYAQKQVSTVLLIPRWPFQALSVIGVLAFCLAIIADMLVAVARAAGWEIDLKEGGKEKLAAD